MGHSEITLSRSFEMCCAHRLLGLPKGHKCGRIHGHNYNLTVSVVSRSLDDTGMVMDSGQLGSMVQKVVVEKLDHFLMLHEEDHLCVLLRDVQEPFAALNFNPTVENLVRYIWDLVAEQLAPLNANIVNPEEAVRVKRITISETGKTVATLEESR